MDKKIVAIIILISVIIPSIFALDLGLNIQNVIAAAGSTNVSVPVNVENNQSIMIFEFNVTHSSYVTFAGVVPSSRMPNASIEWNALNSTMGIVSVIVPNNISFGSGKIMDLKFNVYVLALPGVYSTRIVDAKFLNLDSQGVLSLDINNGLFTII